MSTQQKRLSPGELGTLKKVNWKFSEYHLTLIQQMADEQGVSKAHVMRNAVEREHEWRDFQRSKVQRNKQTRSK